MTATNKTARDGAHDPPSGNTFAFPMKLLGLQDRLEAVMWFMRTLLASSAASFIAAGIFAGTAVGGNPVDKISKQKEHANEKAVVVTGSLIPQRVKLKRIGT